MSLRVKYCCIIMVQLSSIYVYWHLGICFDKRWTYRCGINMSTLVEIVLSTWFKYIYIYCGWNISTPVKYLYHGGYILTGVGIDKIIMSNVGHRTCKLQYLIWTNNSVFSSRLIIYTQCKKNGHFTLQWSFLGKCLIFDQIYQMS